MLGPKEESWGPPGVRAAQGEKILLFARHPREARDGPESNCHGPGRPVIEVGPILGSRLQQLVRVRLCLLKFPDVKSSRMI